MFTYKCATKNVYAQEACVHTQTHTHLYTFTDTYPFTAEKPVTMAIQLQAVFNVLTRGTPAKWLCFVTHTFHCSATAGEVLD